MLSILAWTGVTAQTDAEYEAALAAITNNGIYYVKTNVNGADYYLKGDGTLTTSKPEAVEFFFQKSKGEYKEYGFKLNNNGTYFSNPASSGGIDDTKLNTSTRGDNSWEAQAFFLNGEKYAIRTCNVLPAESGWNHVGSAFWTVKIGDVTTAGYDWNPNYCWELEIDETKTQQSVAYETAANWPFKIQNASGYIKDASQYYSNAKQSNEGTYEAMLDGVYSTYFHSCWSNGPSDDHYLQIELIDPVQEYQFYYKKRHNNNNNRPTKIVISASNDGTNFTDIKTIDSGLPTDEKVLDYVSDVIDLGAAYKYVRYTVLNTNNEAENNGHVFFTFSEFYMIPVKPVFQSAMAVVKEGKAKFSLTSEDIAIINQIEDDLNNAMVDVTYQISFNGKIVATESAQAEPNSTPTLPETLKRDFVAFSNPDVSVITRTDNVVTYTATWDESVFKLSTDYENANWQNMVMRGTWYVTTDNKDNDGAYKTVNENAYGLGTDAYQWAFVGNPWDGFKILNKAEAGKSFGFTKDQKQNQGIPTFLPEDEGEHIWKIAASTSGVGKFYLNVPGTNLYINQFGGAGGSVKFWNSTGNVGDAGSSFTVFDVPSDFSKYVASEISPAFEVDAKYFVYTDAAKAAIGYDPAYKTKCSYETYKAMKDVLTTEFVNNLANYNLPETGYYLLKNKNYGTYLGIDPSDANMYGNYKVCNLPKQIVKLTKNNDNTYTIGLMGKFAPASVAQSEQVIATADAANYAVVITKPGYAAFQADTESKFSCLHCASGGAIVGWEAPADASMWEVLEPGYIEFTVGEAGYATAYFPFAVTIPETEKVAVPEAKGVWTFDDGTTGSLTATDGVTIADGVATVPVGDNLAMSTTGLTDLNTYTFMMDIKVPADKASDNSLSAYTSLFRGADNSGDGGLFIFYKAKENSRKIGIAAGNMGYGSSIELDKWYRVVFSCENAIPTVYVDGVKAVAATVASTNHWTLGEVVRFFADNAGDSEENAVQTTEIRFWDVALNATEAKMLGSVGTTPTVETKTVSAYTGSIMGNWIQTTEVTDGIIPEATPVILKGDPFTYKFKVGVFEEEDPENALKIYDKTVDGGKALAKRQVIPEPVLNNDLKGTFEPISAEGKYVLAKPEGKDVCFYQAISGNIEPCKAYLELNSEVKAFYINFDGNATAIENVNANGNNNSDAIYNLAGQKLSKLQKGINIVNGKKILK